MEPDWVKICDDSEDRCNLGIALPGSLLFVLLVGLERRNVACRARGDD